jgi:hypothetical protein
MPDYDPPTKLAKWISSEAVLAVVDQVANEDKNLSNGAAAILLWDIRLTLLDLIKEA